jgi:hypothetical protein
VKVRIGDTEYDYLSALNKVSLGVLMDLKSQGGPGRRAVALALDLIDEALPTDDAGRIEDDDRVLVGIAGLIFIAKRYAGESVSWSDACGYAWPDIQFVVEAGDLQPVDPTEAPGGQSPVGAETKSAGSSKRKTTGTGTSRTSKPRSTSTF